MNQEESLKQINEEIKYQNEENKVSLVTPQEESSTENNTMNYMIRANYFLLVLGILGIINWIGTKYNYDFFYLFKKSLNLGFPIDKVLGYITSGANIILLSEIIIAIFIIIFIGLVVYNRG